jgi:hypothetical protein
LAFDGLDVEVLVDAVNLAILNMKDEAAEELILLPGGFELNPRKVCLVGQGARRAYSREAYSSFANRFTRVLILPGEAAQ